MKRVIALAAAASLLASCREGQKDFTPTDSAAPTGVLRQLTFSTGADLNPTWSAHGDTVYYTALHFVDYPRTPTTVLRIGTNGGIADLLMPGAQPNGANTIVLPVSSPDGGRIAYVQVTPVLPPAICQDGATAVFPPQTGGPFPCPAEPLLLSGALHIRPVNAASNASLDPGVAIDFPGPDPARSNGGFATSYVQRLFPFQQDWNQTTELLFRPTWSPDGQRIALSDGTSLRMWDLKATSTTSIPNTAGGVSPAWNPKSDVIAFSRIVLGADSIRLTCACHEAGESAGPNHQRWTYTIASQTITVIKPDGSSAVALAQGSEPAWSPDGNMIYYIRDFNIYRIPAAGGTEVKIAQTIGAYSLSVSPNGKWIAFARPSSNNADPNIWVLSLDSQQ